MSVLLLVGCAGYSDFDKEPIRTDVKMYDYNDVAKKYMPRPTRAYIIPNTKTPDKSFIIYQAELYKFSDGYHEKILLSLTKNMAKDAITLLDKFLKWEEIAKQEQDLIEKEIGSVERDVSMGSYKFSITSGNTSSHYLAINFCLMTCLDKYGYMKRDDAITMKNELVKFINDEIKPIAAKYH